MFKNMLLASAMTLSVYALSTNAEAGHRPQGWYVGVEAGATWMDSASIILPGPDAKVGFDTGLAVLAEAGYRWENNWRLEFEAGFRDSDVDCFRFGGAPCAPGSHGDVTQFTQMVNFIHDIDIDEETALSVGIGLGGDLVEFDRAGFVNDSDYVFAAQALLQLSHELTDGIDLVISYRFLTADHPEFARIPGGRFDMEDDTHTVTVGLRFDLESDETVMAPTPVAVSAPPPEPAPEARQFIVFFGYNKSNLNAEALDVVKEAAATAMHDGYVSILVSGHTDTSGSNAYNQKLSLRRAEGVTKALVAQGIPAKGITTNGEGETMLLVQTGDREMEARNRRAEINLN